MRPVLVTAPRFARARGSRSCAGSSPGRGPGATAAARSRGCARTRRGRRRARCRRAPVLPLKSPARTSSVILGHAALTARIVSAQCAAPKSARSSRSTHVITVCSSASSPSISATRRGSSGSGGSGRPVVTSQNRHDRVQMSPRIMIVSARGSSTRRCSGSSRSRTPCGAGAPATRFLSSKKTSPDGSFMRIQGGFGATREVSAAPRRRRRRGASTTDFLRRGRTTWNLDQVCNGWRAGVCAGVAFCRLPAGTRYTRTAASTGNKMAGIVTVLPSHPRRPPPRGENVVHRLNVLRYLTIASEDVRNDFVQAGGGRGR